MTLSRRCWQPIDGTDTSDLFSLHVPSVDLGGPMSPHRPFGLIAAASVTVAALLAGCGSSSSTGASSGTSSAAAAGSGQVTIGVDLTYNNTAFWAAYINYEKQYAQQMHIKLLGPLLAAANASLQNQQIEELVNEGAQGHHREPGDGHQPGPGDQLRGRAPRPADLGRHDRRRRQGLHGRPRLQHRCTGRTPAPTSAQRSSPATCSTWRATSPRPTAPTGRTPSTPAWPPTTPA